MKVESIFQKEEMECHERNITNLNAKMKVNVLQIGGDMSNLDIIKVQTTMQLLYLVQKTYSAIQSL